MYQSRVTYFKKCKTVSVQVKSTQNFIADLSRLLFDGQSLADFYVVCARTITAAFIHLPQETGQLRLTVSFQPEAV